jgi:fumarate reductase (CoM/CoB) subunit B
MGVINYVREEYDSSLAYDRSCRHGRCRDCTVVVNGRSEICCLAPATGDMTIEPIKGYEVIRDLVVNLSKRAR